MRMCHHARISVAAGLMPRVTRTSTPLHQGRDTTPLHQGRDTRPLHQGRDTRPLHEGRENRPLHMGRDTRPFYQGRDTREAHTTRRMRASVHLLAPVARAATCTATSRRLCLLTDTRAAQARAARGRHGHIVTAGPRPVRHGLARTYSRAWRGMARRARRYTLPCDPALSPTRP